MERYGGMEFVIAWRKDNTSSVIAAFVELASKAGINDRLS
jgi:hypothetical protein